MAGLRMPSSGLVFVRGLDQHTIGERDLRRVVAAAPQFYKNHVFNETLLFNLLVGQTWPPTSQALAEATAVAAELGLGDLLDRMPAGMFQHVGDTGWQLSHGERARVFLARTLLQHSEVVILDESFGALDPESLQQCMRAVLARARTLVVITHR
jgi:ABC-type bacteriocin/lantibiotic exporter with double-glycine peptidase domain